MQRQRGHGRVYSQHTQCQCTENICPGLLEWDTDPAMPQCAPSHTFTHLVSSIWWKEPALPHPQPSPKCHTWRGRVLCLQWPGRVEELELSGGLMVHYLRSFCFVFSFICHSWDQSPGSEWFRWCPANTSQEVFPKNQTTWKKIYLAVFSPPDTGILEFLMTCPLPDLPACTAGPLPGCAIFPLAHQGGSSGVPIDSNWMGNPEQRAVPRRWHMGWSLECSVAVLKGNEGAGIKKDLFTDKLRVRLPPTF